MFRCDHHQGANCVSLLKCICYQVLVGACLLLQQTCTNKNLITYAATPPD